MSGGLATSPSRAVLDGGKTVEKKQTRKKGKTIKTDDVIVKLVFEVENTTHEDSLTIVKDRVAAGDMDSFQLGGYLFKICDEKWYEEVGYEKFSEYVADQLGFKVRKAYYLMDFYKAIVNAQLKWADVSDLGWIKLRLLSSIITEENAAEWIKFARKAKGYRELENAIAEAKAGEKTNGSTPPEAGDGTTAMTFKLHPDQKEVVDAALEKAMEAGGTDVKSVALEYICQDFLAGGDRPAPQATDEDVSLVDLMKNQTPEEVMNAFSEVWPEADVTIEM